ncbi:hypothetical protein GEV29_11555 [Aeromicrobium sp. SMF47]|uniref:Uncharacterized protein n=1 Tax=Aeromicrobium yanjiei TaxID=2662028 RepID=A0A5Q2MKT4_9ACTN|nr:MULTISPECIES: hypothetical protein [Aeromicrobium]MRJ77176.1 hypothetical protein [Aeromicrobium yanjiei]MRK01543.1 hypothetical protein [Aeromicrobium sp. S22]QGG41686.1 hypothetical protein GEV26_10125 [Aeromicrobium yanjiei]
MRKTAALLVATVVAATTLSACGGDSDYCAAVKKDQSTLETFAKKRTNDDFAKYRRTTRSLAALAPAEAKKDWTALTTALSGVLDAQKAVGLKLEDVSVSSVAELPVEQSESLNNAYDQFNKTVAKHGKRVEANVKSECSVEL